MRVGEIVIGTFGNQVYNAPTMQSFGGIYASEAYSQFHSPKPMIFNSATTTTAGVILKPLDNIVSRGGDDLLKAGKWTDEGANVFGGALSALSKGDTQILAGRLVGDNLGALPPALEGLSKTALDAAITARLIGKSSDDIVTTLTKMTEDMASQVGRLDAKIAKNFAKQLRKIPTKTGNLGDDIILNPALRKSLGLKALPVSLVDDATSAGIKLADTPAAKRIEDSISVTINNSGAVAGGKEIASLGTKISGAGGKVWKIATPLFAAGILFGGPKFIGTALGFLNIFGAWDDVDLFNLGGDDAVPECPNVGDACDSTTVLASGCYCEDDDGDGDGTIKQQKISVNYEGWAFFGALAVGGIVTIGFINSLLFPRR